MGLEKAIEKGAERRKPYRGSKSFDSSCRNHGGCPWCENARFYQARKLEDAARAEREMELERDADPA